MARWCLALAAVLAFAAGCGSESEGSELGAMTCQEMQAEANEQAKTLEGKLTDLSDYRYVAERIGEPVATVLPDHENEGWFSWFIYYCTKDLNQTAEDAFDQAEEIVEEAGGPQAAQEKYLRVISGKEPPPD